jgi:hypothetical protein
MVFFSDRVYSGASIDHASESSKNAKCTSCHELGTSRAVVKDTCVFSIRIVCVFFLQAFAKSASVPDAPSHASSRPSRRAVFRGRRRVRPSALGGHTGTALTRRADAPRPCGSPASPTHLHLICRTSNRRVWGDPRSRRARRVSRVQRALRRRRRRQRGQVLRVIHVVVLVRIVVVHVVRGGVLPMVRGRPVGNPNHAGPEAHEPGRIGGRPA